MPRTPLLIATLLLCLAACGQQDSVSSDDANTHADNPFFAGATAQMPPQPRHNSAPVDPGRLPPGTIALQRAVISDPGVIAQGPALSALVPAGWRTEGGIVSPQSSCSEPYLVNWMAMSPDGNSGLAIFPTDVWQWSTYPIQSPCPNQTLRSVREFLQAKVAQAFPGARPLDYRNRPDFSRSAEEQAQRLQQMAHGMGLTQMRVYAEGGELLFAFNRNGVDMRGVMGVTAKFQGGVVPNPLDGSAMESFTGYTLGTFLAFAPEGQLNFDLIEATRRSILPDPRWLHSLFERQGQIGRANAQATSELAAIIVAGGAEATRRNIAAFEQIARNSVKNSQQSVAISEAGVAAAHNSGVSYSNESTESRMQRERIEGIRGVETYHDPVDGNQVQLDANYEHAWRVNGQEAYILTRDPNFNPGAYGIEATQMGTVR